MYRKSHYTTPGVSVSKFFHVQAFYVMGKVRTGKLSCMWTCLVFSSPEPKAQGELLPSANVCRATCVVCRQQLLQTTSPLKPLGLGP